MGQDDREVLAQMLAEEFEAAVFMALRVVHEHQVPPFDDGYDRTPFNDFVGRLDDWPWAHLANSDGTPDRRPAMPRRL
jgi:hypothetical protein